jgi:HAMP domain-containing protein
MPTSRLFWKLVLTCAGLNFLAAVAVGLVLSTWLQGQVADIDEVRGWVWLLVVIESILVFGLAYWLIGLIVRPIDSLNAAANAIAAGDYQHRVYVPSRDELGTLASTLNRMSQALGQRMSQRSRCAFVRNSTSAFGSSEPAVRMPRGR